MARGCVSVSSVLFVGYIQLLWVLTSLCVFVSLFFIALLRQNSCLTSQFNIIDQLVLHLKDIQA